jgi:uncharacterized membrane protein
MKKITSLYEAVFLTFIYAIIVYYSVSAMLKLIDDCKTAMDLAKMILLYIFWLTLIPFTGAVLVSSIAHHKNKRRK